MTIKKFLALPTLALTVAIPLMATTSTTAHAQRINQNLRAPAPIVCIFNERGAGRVAVRARQVRQTPGFFAGQETRGRFALRSGLGRGRNGAPNMRLQSTNPFSTLRVSLISPRSNVTISTTNIPLRDIRRGGATRNISFTEGRRNSPRRSGRLTCRFV